MTFTAHGASLSNKFQVSASFTLQLNETEILLSGSYAVRIFDTQTTLKKMHARTENGNHAFRVK